MRTIKIIFAVLIISIIASCTKDNEVSYDSIGSFAVSGDRYNDVTENPFINVSDQAISTFSVDADGASYANIRRYIQEDNQLPPSDAVRTEEMLNYFNLNYDYSDQSHPINLNGEISECPWNTANKLIRIGIKGKPIADNDLPASNFVFLIDVSGSMGSDDKLELLKNGFKYFVDELTIDDKVAIVTYAGSATVLLQSTTGDQKTIIKDAIESLGSGGGTAGAQGIITAYEIASQNFIANGNNRIIIGTDGDFNIGTSSQEDLVTLIEEKRESGIYLTVLGVGRGNYNDAALEQIANNGNGTFEYIDNLEQLRKVFIYDYSKFYTVAKDVKVQVEFNPNNVESYRLIGYENRLMEESDFEDDTKDAGEIGANQNITALYEIVPNANATKNYPTFTIDFRYKEINSDVSLPLELQIFDEDHTFAESSDFMKFTSSVASFSMLITNSQYKGISTYDDVLSWLNSTNLDDEHNFKAEFKSIVTKAKTL